MLTLRWYPELRKVPTAAERRTILRKAFHQCGNNPIVVGAALQMIVGTILFTRPLARFVSTYLATGAGWFGDTAAGAIIAFITGMVFMGVTNSTIRKHIRMELVARGFTICVQCGYDLRGLTELRCPECGLRFNHAASSKVDANA